MNIGIFLPSSNAPQGETRNYKFLNQQEITVIEHPLCNSVYSGYLAGNARDRADVLHEMYQDDRIDVIMSFWGGYNTNEILQHIDFDLIKEYYKPTIGYSDTTALLNAITKHTGHITYLGPGGITFLKPEPIQYSFDYMMKALKGDREIFIHDSDVYADDAYYLRKEPENLARIIKPSQGHSVIQGGIAEGTIVAGNLQTLAVLAGTPHFPILNDTILFLEEDEQISAPLFRRFLTQLASQEKFHTIRGIAFGRFHESVSMSTSQFSTSINDILHEIKGPIIANLDFGHTDPQFTIPIGGRAHINTSTKTLIFNQ